MNDQTQGAKDPSIKLYEVLLDEYQKLEIIDSSSRNAVEEEMNTEFSGLNWFDFKMNDWIQTRRMKMIRRRLHDIFEASASETSEKMRPSPTALCFSGGGIRSATYCLGVLQGLAKFGLLDKFDYLSTVSGGGYIGSWLSAWVDRAGSVEKVQAALCSDESNPFLYELNDFRIDFDNLPDSLKSFEIPLGLSLESIKGTSSGDEHFLKEFEDSLNHQIRLHKTNDGEKALNDFELKAKFKKLCSILNRLILSKKAVEREVNQQFCVKLNDRSLKSIERTREEIDEKITRILRKPYLLTKRDFLKQVSEKDLNGECKKTEAELEALRNELKSSEVNAGQAESAGRNAGRKKEKIEFLEGLIKSLSLEPESNDDPSGKNYFDRLIDLLNKQIDDQDTKILSIKAKRRISTMMGTFLKPYVESDLLQNADTANTLTEAEEITHLRSYSNYMSPKLGLFSTDTFSLIGLYLRNLLLNWLVFVPLIAAVLLIPKIFVAILNKQSFFYQFERLIPVKLLSIFSLTRNDVAGFFNYFTPSWVDYGAVLLLIMLIGTFGVHCINYLRPSLSGQTRIKQIYTISKIGIAETFERQIFRYCFLPIVVIAFGLPVYMNWIQSGEIELIHGKYEFIALGVSLFLGGFVISRGLMIADAFLWKLKKGEGKFKFEFRNSLFELFIAAGCGVIGGLMLYFATERLIFFTANYDEYAIPLFVTLSAPIFILSFLVAATIFIGVASRITDDMDREWMTRFGAMLLKVVFFWIVLASTVLLGELALNALNSANINGLLASIGGISGVLTLVLGFSSKSTEDKPESAGTWKNLIIGFAPQIAAPVFIIFLIGSISWLTNLMMVHTAIINPWIWFIGLSAFGGILGFFINVNKFSLHAMYRERLIRTYLGASRLKERFKTANSFTDLDPNDNVEMKYLFQKPYHVVNMTLNLVKTQNLRWQNRKAESFTASALYCGSSNMGNGTGHYRLSKNFAVNEQNQRAITLGTAAAISGAAASPNMGYFTVSSAVTFLMALFNIRLGWWLGNPGNAGEFTYPLATPKWSPQLLFAEALGGTTDTYPYIYVSDGGHFENLGLYEMVLRRCKLIVVIDSGCDPKFTFSDLGNAIHKIRVDMGVPIIFSKDPMKGKHCTVADIRYSEIDGNDKRADGKLIYFKPTLDGTEPIDIKQYKFSNNAFPHESTSDQMYSETQFESYRTLGFHAVNKISSGLDGTKLRCEDLYELYSRAVSYSDAIKNTGDVREEKK